MTIGDIYWTFTSPVEAKFTNEVIGPSQPELVKIRRIISDSSILVSTFDRETGSVDDVDSIVHVFVDQLYADEQAVWLAYSEAMKRYGARLVKESAEAFITAERAKQRAAMARDRETASKGV